MPRLAGRVGSAALLVTAAVILSQSGTIAADGTPPFSFAETGVLEETCGKLVSGLTLIVRNDTAEDHVLNLRLDTTVDSDGHVVKPVDVCGGLTVMSDEGVVPAGTSAALKVTAKQTTKDGPTLTTAVVAFAETGPVARRTIKLAKAATAVDALPLAATLPVTRYRYSIRDLLAFGLSTHGDLGHFWSYLVAPPDWTVSVPVKVAPGETISINPGDTVGVLVGEQGRAVVTYTGAPERLNDSTSLITLRVPRLPAGTYAGTLDLAPTDKDTGTFTLDLTAKHEWPLPTLALLVGLVAAALVQRWNGYFLTRGRLLERSTAICYRYVEILKSRYKGLPPKNSLRKFRIKDLQGAVENVQALIEQRTRGTAVQIDPKIVDDLTVQIVDLEEKVESLDKLPEAAADLERALDRLNTERPAALPPLGKPDSEVPPAVQVKVRALLSGGKLTAAELVERLAAIKTMTSTIGLQHHQEGRLSKEWQQYRILEVALGADHPGLKELRSSLASVRHELWTAETSEDVQAATGDLDAARAGIDKIWPSIPDMPPRQRSSGGPAGSLPFFDVTELVKAQAFSRLRFHPGVRLRYEFDQTGYVTPQVAVVRPPPISAASAQGIIVGARVRQFAVLMIASVVALIAGLTLLYIGKPWGTPWDYVTALAWGLITGTASVVAISAAIEGLASLGALRRTPGASWQ